MATSVVELSGDEAKLVRALQRVLAQQTRNSSAFKEMGGAADRAGKQAARSFGQEAAAGMRRYASSIAGVVGAANLAQQALRAMDEAGERGKQTLTDTRTARERLLSIARGDSAEEVSADFQAMLARADAAAVRFGLSRDEAMNALFTARSEGFEEDFETVVRVRPIMDLETASTLAGQIPALFAGRQDISIAQALTTSLRAAEASRVDPQRFARALPAVASGEILAGGDLAGAQAALSVLASSFKTELEAADRIKAFGARVQGTEFGGAGVIEGLARLIEADAETRAAFLGDSVELKQFFEMSQGRLEELRAALAQIREEEERVGTDQSRVSLRVAAGEMDESMRAERAARSAETRRLQAEEVEGRAMLGRERRRDARITRLRSQGRGAEAIAQNVADFLLPDRFETARGILGRGLVAPLNIRNEQLELRAAWSAQTAAIERQTEASSRLADLIAQQLQSRDEEERLAAVEAMMRNPFEALQVLGAIRNQHNQTPSVGE